MPSKPSFHLLFSLIPVIVIQSLPSFVEFYTSLHHNLYNIAHDFLSLITIANFFLKPSSGVKRTWRDKTERQKMKIFCHPDIVNSLKLLIAKEVGGVANVALESVHPETRVVPFLTSPTLPVLQLDDGEVRDNGRS